MAQKLKLRELGMDTMERLYYERQNERRLSYEARKRKKSTLTKKHQTKQTSDIFDQTTRRSTYNLC